MNRPERVAIVHDWLTGMRGGERVLEELCTMFPTADIYTLIYAEGSVSDVIASHRIITSQIQKLPKSWVFYRYFLPLFPAAIETFDLNDYDLVISSSHCVAKGVCTSPRTLNLCYCYTPMRYAWDLAQAYIELAKLNRLAKKLIPFAMNILRMWDALSAQRPDDLAAISRHIARRIQKYYRRSCRVIYPPVDCQKFAGTPRKGDYYLTVSAPAPYKRLDIIVEAFRKLGRRLVVVGTSSNDLKQIGKLPANIELLGWIEDSELVELYLGARAFVFSAEEDFGIAPVEAQAAGKPVIAFGRGGTLETVRGLWSTGDVRADADRIRSEGLTGIWYGKQSVADLISAIRYFEMVEDSFDEDSIRSQAQRFSRERFRREFMSFVEERWRSFQEG